MYSVETTPKRVCGPYGSRFFEERPCLQEPHAPEVKVYQIIKFKKLKIEKHCENCLRKAKLLEFETEPDIQV